MLYDTIQSRLGVTRSRTAVQLLLRLTLTVLTLALQLSSVYQVNPGRCTAQPLKRESERGRGRSCIFFLGT